MNFNGMTKKEITQYALENGHATVLTQLQNDLNGYGFVKAQSVSTPTREAEIEESKCRTEIDTALQKANQ